MPGVNETSSSLAYERLHTLEAVTDRALVSLGTEELLVELLDRVRDLLLVDTTAVLLLDPAKQQLIATAARGLEEEVRQGVRIPLGKGFAGRIAAEKHPVFLEEVNHKNVLNPILREKGIRSLLGVPLLVADKVLGVLHVGTLAPRHFTDEEIELLQLVADRVALAVQSRISQNDQAAATALQRGLLPVTPPEVDGFDFASRYVPGGRGQVGGDWYDVFMLPSGLLWVVIGDVLGRGLFAAATMGHLRSALRAYAMETDDPSVVLAKLDRQFQHFEPDGMATVLCGVVQPDGRRLRLSSAGHVPPILAYSDTPARLVEVPPDLPVGIDATRPRQVTDLDLPEGSVLCMYTDGLVERRKQSIDIGIERLRASVHPGAPEKVCIRVMAALVGAEEIDDDVALFVLRRRHQTHHVEPARP
jgi:serine phosphatase RsbU (regulator of sigma subunit)